MIYMKLYIYTYIHISSSYSISFREIWGRQLPQRILSTPSQARQAQQVRERGDAQRPPGPQRRPGPHTPHGSRGSARSPLK